MKVLSKEKDMDCLISVIVPVYKVEKYIHRCVDSVLNQTFTDFELILVDDGSPDNCGAICDEYALKDNRIHVIHKENGGLSDARNAGIDWAFENSNSEWLTFIDSDDWVHPKYLESLYYAVIESGCSISVCGYQETTGEDPDVDENQLRSIMVDTEQFFCEHNTNAVVAWGKLYKKELFIDIRYPFGKLHEDEFTTYKLLFQSRKIIVVNKALYFYFSNSNGITGSLWTPQHLDQEEGVLSSIHYFKKNSYTKALYFQIQILIYSSYNQYLQCYNTEGLIGYKKYPLKYLRIGLKLADKYNIHIDSYNYYRRLVSPNIYKYKRLSRKMIERIKETIKCRK